MRRAALVTAVATVVTVAGCGGDDRLSSEDYQREGNAICSKYDRQIDAIPEPEESAESVVAYVNKVIPLVEDQIDEMRELKPPEEDQEAHDEMLREAERIVEAARDLRAAAEDNDQTAARQAIEAGDSASDNADSIAEDLGLDACVD